MVKHHGSHLPLLRFYGPNLYHLGLYLYRHYGFKAQIFTTLGLIFTAFGFPLFRCPVRRTLPDLIFYHSKKYYFYVFSVPHFFFSSSPPKGQFLPIAQPPFLNQSSKITDTLTQLYELAMLYSPILRV